MRLLLAAIVAIAAASPAAAIINAPLPANAFITVGSLDWAWASACAPGPGYGNEQSCAPIDLSYQSTQGWRVAEAADFANAPVAADFQFVGAYSTLGFACAADFFATAFTCDFGDGQAGAVFNNPASQFVGNPNVDTWVVRDAGTGGAVPEPASWAMLIAGFGLVGAIQRRRKAAVAA